MQLHARAAILPRRRTDSGKCDDSPRRERAESGDRGEVEELREELPRSVSGRDRNRVSRREFDREAMVLTFFGTSPTAKVEAEKVPRRTASEGEERNLGELYDEHVENAAARRIP